MHPFFIIIIFCLLTSTSRAEIPLELVAEFDLREDADSWDVNYWMDDSTLGWAILANDTVFYTPRVGEPVVVYVLPSEIQDSICTGWCGWSVQSICLMRHTSLPNTPLFALSVGFRLPVGSSYDYDHLLLVVSPEQDEILYFDRRDTGYFSNSHGWNDYEETAKLIAWPPPPASTEKILCANRQYRDFEGTSTRSEENVITTQFDIVEDSLVITYFTGSPAFFSNSSGDIAFNNSLRGDEEGSEYGYSRVAFYDSELSLTSELLVCNHRACLNSGPVTFNTFQHGKNFVVHGIVFSTPVIEILDTLTYPLAASLALAPDYPEYHWTARDSQFVIRNPYGNWSDSTTVINRYYFERTVKKMSGDGALVVRARTMVNDNHHILIYEPNVPTFNVTIAYLPFAESLRLIWNSYPGASSYEVCRSTTAEGDFCDEYIHFVSDTSLILPIQFATPKQFFRVRAVFE